MIDEIFENCRKVNEDESKEVNEVGSNLLDPFVDQLSYKEGDEEGLAEEGAEEPIEKRVTEEQAEVNQIKIYPDSSRSVGTYYLGVIARPLHYNDLVKLFGNPSRLGSPEDKMQVQWVGKIDGKVFTIYDYVSNKPVEQLVGDDWHIGGKDEVVVQKVNDYIEELEEGLAEESKQTNGEQNES